MLLVRADSTPARCVLRWHVQLSQLMSILWVPNFQAINPLRNGVVHGRHSRSAFIFSPSLEIDLCLGFINFVFEVHVTLLWSLNLYPLEINLDKKHDFTVIC